MKGFVKIKGLFWTSVVFLFFMSSTMLLMPISSDVINENRIFAVVVGALFWLCAIVGYSTVIVSNIKMKKFIAENSDITLFKTKRAGAFRFFSNPVATVIDALLILSFALFVFFTIKSNTDYIVYVTMFILIFTLNAHCIFNGKIYKLMHEKK